MGIMEPYQVYIAAFYFMDNYKTMVYWVCEHWSLMQPLYMLATFFFIYSDLVVVCPLEEGQPSSVSLAEYRHFAVQEGQPFLFWCCII